MAVPANLLFPFNAYVLKTLSFSYMYLEHPECDFYQDKEIEVQRHQHMHSQILKFLWTFTSLQEIQ